MRSNLFQKKKKQIKTKQNKINKQRKQQNKQQNKQNKHTSQSSWEQSSKSVKRETPQVKWEISCFEIGENLESLNADVSEYSCNPKCDLNERFLLFFVSLFISFFLFVKKKI